MVIMVRRRNNNNNRKSKFIYYFNTYILPSIVAILMFLLMARVGFWIGEALAGIEEEVVEEVEVDVRDAFIKQLDKEMEEHQLPPRRHIN